jgi:thiamine-phosphate pyrophosphorylase
MLIVVSDPVAHENEAALINLMFDEGLELLHVRKPGSRAKDIRDLVDKIKTGYYSKLVFHQHHDLAKDYGISRLHFNETNRKNVIGRMPGPGFRLSTSIHAYNDLKDLSPSFDYAFLGPVFDSISKKNYKAVDFIDDMCCHEERNIKLIAIGGITKDNLQQAFKRGFNGVAVLGSVWGSKDPVQEFVQIKERCRSYEIMS